MIQIAYPPGPTGPGLLLGAERRRLGTEAQQLPATDHHQHLPTTRLGTSDVCPSALSARPKRSPNCSDRQLAELLPILGNDWHCSATLQSAGYHPDYELGNCRDCRVVPVGADQVPRAQCHGQEERDSSQVPCANDHLVFSYGEMILTRLSFCRLPVTRPGRARLMEYLWNLTSARSMRSTTARTGEPAWTRTPGIERE